MSTLKHCNGGVFESLKGARKGRRGVFQQAGVFRHAQVLLFGTILAPGRRTLRSALRAMGLGHQKRFHRYHRVLSHACWSSVEASRILLWSSLVEVFVPKGDPPVVGIDETLQRRYWKKISAKGVYCDPVRSTHEHFVKSSGLR